MASDIEVQVPDIGDFESVDVIDVLVKPGDLIRLEDPLVTLESDKATMDVPAPVAGRVISISVHVGDKVAQGRLLLTVAAEAEASPATPEPSAMTPAPAAVEAVSTESPVAAQAAPEPEPAAPAPVAVAPITRTEGGDRYGFNSPDPGPRTLEPPGARQILTEAGARIYASPGLRKFARELGVDLARVEGTGRKQRILREDITGFVKKTLSSDSAREGGSFSLPTSPEVDFSRFGSTETTPLSRIRRSSGQNLHRAWVGIPHVTQFDEADITDLETFRKAKSQLAGEHGVKLTLVAFLLKALAAAMRRYPDFNSSLSADGASLIHKHYLHLGVAVNTERGLLVPGVRDVDQKGLLALALDLKELSDKARAGKLSPAEMQGACMTITSLGGIGGTAFTPIINPPEVAILGVSPARIKPEWREENFVPRLMLPLSLSYDHRVIDGVAAAEFARHLSRLLGDIRELML